VSGNDRYGVVEAVGGADRGHDTVDHAQHRHRRHVGDIHRQTASGPSQVESADDEDVAHQGRHLLGAPGGLLE